jgi:molecular chaperone DnaK (HSP70)
MKTSNKVFGIDLGTTYSCVSYVGETGKPEIVPNDNFERTTPSVVWFDGSRVVVGSTALFTLGTTGAEKRAFFERIRKGRIAAATDKTKDVARQDVA